MRKFLPALCLILTFAVAAGQDNGQLRKAYEDAAKMRNDGNKLLLKDEAKAVRILHEANRIHPPTPDLTNSGPANYSDALGRFLVDKGDIRGANQWADTLIARYNAMKEAYHTPGLSAKPAPAAVFIKQVLLFRAEANVDYGDLDVARNDIKRLIELGIDEDDYKKKRTGWTGAYFAVTLQSLMVMAQYNAFLAQDLELIKLTQPVLERFNDRNYATTGKIYIAILEKKYPEAIALAQAFEADDKVNARFLLAWAYAEQKNTAKSEEYIAMLLKDIRIGPGLVTRLRGLNARNEAEWDKLEEYASAGLKPLHVGFMKVDQPGKFFFYTLRGDAFTGKKQYQKAKAEYEKALLYNPGSVAAQTGLANLEGLIATEKRADKEGPAIRISEPAAARGAVAATPSAELVVRGTIDDPSGVKSVTVNGQPAYFQPDGTFWTSTKLHDGVNKFLISATDLAGNTSQQSLDVTKTTPVNQDVAIVPVVQKEAKNYALLIAAQNYDDPAIPSLDNPVADAIKLKLALKNGYNFADDNVFTLFNPTTSDFQKQFAQIMDVIQPDDNLVIFYAGHGIWSQQEQKGYWLLTDARRNNPNSWLSNGTVLDMISKIPARHTLLVTDACFSGSVFKSRGLGADAPAALREMSEKISRVAITSGNDSEVPDQSVFMKYLVKALSENKEKYLTAQKMFINQIIEAVMTETKTEPRYGTLEAAGHIGGDYIFSKK